jgi:hypothetical protein
MNRKKGFIVAGISVAAVLVIVLVGSMVAQAWGPARWAGGGFHHCGWGHPGLGGGKTMMDFVLWRMDDTTKGLNLTPTQKEKYDKLRSSLTSHGAIMTEEHKALRADVHAEMTKEIPDIAMVTPKLKKAISDISMDIQANIDLVTDFYGSLDNSQKKKVMSSIKDKME